MDPLTDAMGKEVILVGVDESAISAGAFHHALALARLHPDAELHAVNVIDGYDPMRARELAYAAGKVSLKAEREQFAARIAELTAGLDDLPPIERHVLMGPAGKEIIQVARRIGASLIVVGTHGRTGIGKWVLGNVAGEVVRLAGCPVLTYRPKNWAPTGDSG